jgi:hypothetical protein
MDQIPHVHRPRPRVLPEETDQYEKRPYRLALGSDSAPINSTPLDGKNLAHGVPVQPRRPCR